MRVGIEQRPMKKIRQIVYPFNIDDLHTFHRTNQNQLCKIVLAMAVL